MVSALMELAFCRLLCHSQGTEILFGRDDVTGMQISSKEAETAALGSQSNTVTETHFSLQNPKNVRDYTI